MRIILVEDESDLGSAIKQNLILEHYIVDWFQDGQEALDYLNMNWVEYTVAIVDWMLPTLSGIELCKNLRNNQFLLPILMLTAKDRIEDKILGLDSGADDYLIKPFRVEELLARLRALARRAPQYQDQQIQIGKLILDYGKRTICFESKPEIVLTAKEFHLLEYLMRHPNQILTGEQIRDQLWDIDSESMSNVVAAQIRLLRKKLSKFTSQCLIETFYGSGYRFNSDNASK